jgi:hypothetical protein
MVRQKDDGVLDRHGTTAEARPGAAWDDGESFFAGKMQDGGDLFGGARSQDGQREPVQKRRSVVCVGDAVFVRCQDVLRTQQVNQLSMGPRGEHSEPR